MEDRTALESAVVADVQALSASNAPPPDALIAQLNSVAGGELRYHRAMSMGFHVFQFTTPKTMSDAAVILERIRALPEIEQVTEETATKPRVVYALA